ncbi:MAG TPA: hypothetical protein VLC93_10855 [Myxococcota bacterium]|nr:hypothetical protein [Myxococcota bacterium]
MLRTATFVALALVGCSRPPAPGPPAAKAHMPSLGIERQDLGLDATVRINDFPVHLARLGQQSWFGELATSLQGYTVLHPYFLRNGENAFAATYVVSDGRCCDDFGPYAATYTITDLDYEHLSRETTLARFAIPALSKDEGALPRTITGTFASTTTVPEWSWLHGERITDDTARRNSLYAAYAKLWQDLEGADGKSKSYSPYAAVRHDLREFATATEMLEGQYDDWDIFFDLAARRRTAFQEPIVLRELPERDATTLRVFGNGALAYLAVEANSFFEHPVYLELVGGAHDAPSGTMGPVDEIVSPWFRLDGKGGWMIDGLVR